MIKTKLNAVEMKLEINIEDFHGAMDEVISTMEEVSTQIKFESQKDLALFWKAVFAKLNTDVDNYLGFFGISDFQPAIERKIA